MLANFVVDTNADEAFDGGDLASETADGNGLSLREALGLANGVHGDDDGDRIDFDDLWSGSIELDPELGQLSILDDVTIDGGGVVVVDAGGYSRVLHVDASGAAGLVDTVVLRGLELVGGDARTEDGGGVLFDDGENGRLEGVLIRGNRATNGGGVAVVNSRVTVSNSRIEQNTAIRVMDSENAQNGAGGGMFLLGPARVDVIGGVVANNHAASDGGGAWNSSQSVLNFDGTTILANTAGEQLGHASRLLISSPPGDYIGGGPGLRLRCHDGAALDQWELHEGADQLSRDGRSLHPRLRQPGR